MAETKINANQTSITAEDIGAAGAVATLPTASASEEGKIYQFTGTTDVNYTNGYFYKCVSDGQDPAAYSWVQTDVQPSSGGSSLPDQTGNAGKFLTTDGTDASWSDKPLVNTATGTDSLTVLGTATSASDSVNIGTGSIAYAGDNISVGYNARAYKSNDIVIGVNSNTYAYSNGNGIVIGNGRANNGANAQDYIVIGHGSGVAGGGRRFVIIGNNGSTFTDGTDGVAVGYNAKAGYRSVALGSYAGANPGGCMINCSGVQQAPNVNTLCFANQNGSYIVIDSDGKLPTNRWTTTPSSDGTYVPTLTISSGTASRSWAAPAGGVDIDSTTITKNGSDELQAVATVNKNTASGAQNPVYDWIGTLAEYQTQDIETLHPEYVCLITDDNDGGDSVYTKDQVDVLVGGRVPTGHEVIEFQAPTAQNNYTWYRKYADGWVEQGGAYGGSQNQTISLPVEMADNNYSVMLSFSTTSGNTPTYSSYAYRDKTTTSFVAINSGSINGDWEVKGVAATPAE